VKKAVDFGFLDFTTLKKRKHQCLEELRLNRRLAPETYRDVVAISADAEGRLSLATGGHIIEYAVKMKKLPQERMLKMLLATGAAEPSMMDRIAAGWRTFTGMPIPAARSTRLRCGNHPAQPRRKF